MLASVILVLTLASGLRYVTVSSDYRYFFGDSNPQRQAFESLQRVYSKDDSVLIAVTPEDGVVFKKETLTAISDLTRETWKLPFVTRVDSVTNFQHSFAEGDDLIVKDLVTSSDIDVDDNTHYASLQRVALHEPLLRNRLINEQATVTGINVKMTFPGASPFEVPDAAQATRDLVAKFKTRYPGHEVHLTGMVMLNDAFNEAGIRDVMTLMPIMYLLITAFLFVLLRSISAVATTLGVMVLSILGAMGFSGWSGIPITPPSSIAPTVIMTLAIAHSIHFLKTMHKAMATGIGRNEAITESLKQNLKPIFLTSLTTMVGFLSLNFSDTPPFHDLGNITAVGVALSFALSVGFLPAVMTQVKARPGLTSVERNDLAARYAAWINRRKIPVILIVFFATAFLAAQVSNIKINDQFVGYFDESIQFRPDSEYTIENLTGVYQLNFDLRAGEADGISDPHYLEIIEQFASYLRSIPNVIHVDTITDIFKRLNMNMHGDDPAEYKLPKQRDLAAQYLLLYEMSLPYGLDLNSQINVSKSSSRVLVTLDEVSTSRILEISQAASLWLEQHAPNSMSTEATSPTVMFSHITERNIHAMLWGTVIALTLITIVMIVALGSVRYGLISLLPNVIPATIAIGLWSVLVGEAGFSIAFVASVTLGIIVDDTVHFLSKFNYAMREGRPTQEAISYALEHVGSALISTSIVLVVGFSVLMLSGFKLNFVLGALSALTIAVALLVDFTFLPALLGLSSKSVQPKGGIVKMKYATYSTMAVVLAIGISFTISAFATTTTAEEKGQWVAISADQYDQGFVSQTAKVTMILRNSHGQTAERQLRIKILEVANDGDKSMTIFDTPRDVRGTSFLSYSHSIRPDEQWLYLPSLKRIKRISSNNKSGPFMGSEFAYEDLASQEVDKYTYRYVESQMVHNEPGHVVERQPVDTNSGYARQKVWVDGTHWRPAKIEFYDRKNELLKTVTYTDYKRYSNDKWRASKMVMENHQTGKSTTLLWEDIQFGADLSSRDFDKNALKRIR
jgi:predicted RND superfamily exporter protein